MLAKENFIYFVGGKTSASRWSSMLHLNGGEILRYVDRYDLSTNTWEKIADLQEPRSDACGAAAHGKIFIAGGDCGQSCEVYNETTNTWQYTKVFSSFYSDSTLTCVEGKLYVVTNGNIVRNGMMILQGRIVVKCYDNDSNQWKEASNIPPEMLPVRPTSPHYRPQYDVDVIWCSSRGMFSF